MTVTSNEPKSIILLRQPGMAAIEEPEMLEALPEDLHRLSRQVLTIKTDETPLDQADNINWADIQQQIRASFANEIYPALKSTPNATVHYFGLAPIPSLLLAGYLYGAVKNVSLYHRSRDHKRGWRWDNESAKEGPEINVTTSAKELVSAPGDLIVRVSTSFEIDKSSTRAIVPEPLGELDINISPLSPDALETQSSVNEVAKKVAAEIQNLLTLRPAATTIHLFAAVSTELAFKLGASLNPTMLPEVQTYQFWRKGSPKYLPAFPLNDNAVSPTILTDEERKRAAQIRSSCNKQLSALQEFTKQVGKTDSTTWLDSVVEAKSLTLPSCFAIMPRLDRSQAIIDAKVSFDTSQVSGGFGYDRSTRTWALDDSLLLAFSKMFDDSSDLDRALRMFILHESVHDSHHGLTTESARRIGRHARVLEEVDYQADVWAMVHEYTFTVASEPEETPRAIFQRIVNAAIKSFWAFDTGPGKMTQIQVRRINRYLNWYWQLLRIERSDNLNEILEILLDRPWIELAGPRIESTAERIFYRLDGPYIRPEICYLHRNRIRRTGHSDGAPVEAVLRGFLERKPLEVKNALKSIFDQND